MSWVQTGNIQGPPGTFTGSIPDPLVLNEIHAGVTLYVGSHARFVALVNGVRLEVMDGTGAWIPQNQWTES
jgi:hypothetical protein